MKMCAKHSQHSSVAGCLSRRPTMRWKLSVRASGDPPAVRLKRISRGLAAWLSWCLWVTKVPGNHPETPARPRLIRLSRTTGGGVAGQTASSALAGRREASNGNVAKLHTFLSASSQSIGIEKETAKTVSFLLSHPHRPVSGNWNLHIRRICLFQLHWQDSRSRLLGLQPRCIPSSRRSAPYHNPPEHLARKTDGRRDERAATVGYLQGR